jgi:hypothetical protein
MLRNLNQGIKQYADSATGSFVFTGPHDQWLIDRTRQWCGLHTRSEWSYQINMSKGLITFQFVDQRDADAFRRVTSRTPTLITCQ